jgi:GNAT superfamily N-acetyltransferase
MAPPDPTPPPSYTYRIHRIPTSDPSLIYYFTGRYSALRLSALQTSPHAYGTTFARESAWPPSEFIARLQRPHVNTFVAIAYAPGTPVSQQTILAGDWVACGTLLGPTPLAAYEAANDGGPALGPDEVEDKYHMGFVYNEPLHRGKGVTKMLIQEALNHTVREARERARQSSWMRICIHPDNLVVRKLYARFDFEDAGKCTFAEAVTANGEEDLLPPDGGFGDVQKYHRKVGLRMMKRSVVSAEDV